MTITYEAPRNGSGTSGTGGKCRMFAQVISSSGNVGKSSRHQGEKIRSQAGAGYEELLGRSEDLLRELQHGYERGATEMRDTVRKHPLATIGAAAAFGLAIAFLARR